MNNRFIERINAGYTFNGESIILGAGMHEGECDVNAKIIVQRKKLNSHGLIAGAAASGKTKTQQKIAEALSKEVVHTLMMDIKKELRSIATVGMPNDKINQQQKKIGVNEHPKAYPTEILSIINEPGAELRTTVFEFGPVLFSKILALNNTQSDNVSLEFIGSGSKRGKKYSS